MRTLVSDISLLAASRAPHFVELAEVDLEAFTAAVGARHPLDPARTWRVESARRLALLDTGHITPAWLQLADNAVKHSNPGAPIVIVAEVAETPTVCRIRCHELTGSASSPADTAATNTMTTPEARRQDTSPPTDVATVRESRTLLSSTRRLGEPVDEVLGDKTL